MTKTANKDAWTLKPFKPTYERPLLNEFKDYLDQAKANYKGKSFTYKCDFNTHRIIAKLVATETNKEGLFVQTVGFVNPKSFEGTLELQGKEALAHALRTQGYCFDIIPDTTRVLAETCINNEIYQCKDTATMFGIKSSTHFIVPHEMGDIMALSAYFLFQVLEAITVMNMSMTYKCISCEKRSKAYEQAIKHELVLRCIETPYLPYVKTHAKTKE